MKISIPHLLLLVIAIIAAAIVAGCADTATKTPAPNTHNDGSMKVHSGPYDSMGSADPQAPREPR